MRRAVLRPDDARSLVERPYSAAEAQVLRRAGKRHVAATRLRLEVERQPGGCSDRDLRGDENDAAGRQVGEELANTVLDVLDVGAVLVVHRRVEGYPNETGVARRGCIAAECETSLRDA